MVKNSVNFLYKLIFSIALVYIFFKSDYSIFFLTPVVISIVFFYFFILNINFLNLYRYLGIIFFIFYPLTYIVGCILNYNEFKGDEYHHSLWFYNLFIIFFTITYSFLSKLKNYHVEYENLFKFNIKNAWIIFLTLTFIIFLIRWINGILFHIAINPDYNFNAGNVENYVKILTSLAGSIPIFLLLSSNKLHSSKKQAYLMIFLLIAFHMPTGLRSATLIPAVTFIVIGFMAKRISIKEIIIFSLIISAVVALQGNIRRSDGDEIRSLDGNIAQILGRVSDLRNTGLIISYAEDRYQNRGFEDLENYPLCFFPNIVRTTMGIPCFTNESTAFTHMIGLTPGHWSSEPITIIGDGYSRFGFFGVILVGIIAGLLIYFNDFLIKTMGGNARYIYYALVCQLLFSVYSASLLNFLLIATRDTVLIWFLTIAYKNFTKINLRSL